MGWGDQSTKEYINNFYWVNYTLTIFYDYYSSGG